jgi:succinyl-CoA synthetase beta subunit
MNIHEYQAKQILREHGVKVPNGKVAFTLDEVEQVVKELKSAVFAVKAQIHAGGRGKAGGVKIVSNAQDARKAAEKMLGKKLVTIQTGPEGQTVGRIYIEEGSDIEKEYYLSLVLDRENNCLTFIASKEGGVEIEEVALHHPEKIKKVHVNPSIGLQDFHVRQILFGLGFTKEKFNEMRSLLYGIYNVFIEKDANQIEINPLITTKSGEIVALDAKINFDDNGLFRQSKILELRDEAEEDPIEIRASKAGLSYVKMDGSIGCLVNGAGLAMATMDIIKLYGGSPANFLDVGGGANKEKVTEAFKIILSDHNVKAILVNIFGGIMKCSIIAEGVVAAAKEIGLNVPLVVRLEGTSVEEGKRILRESGLKIESAADLKDAAEKVAIFV